MNKIFSLFGSFRVRVTLALLLSLFFVLGLNNLAVYNITVHTQVEQLREKLMTIAQTAALMVKADTLKDIPLNRAGVDTPSFEEVSAILRKVKDANPMIKYIYIMEKTEKRWIWRFVVDPDPSGKDIEGKFTSYPGDTYDVRRCPGILRALYAPSADKSFTFDEWGVFLSGYAPIRNAKGDAVYVLGVDMPAQDVYSLKKRIYLYTALVLLVGLFISIIIGLVISGRITDPIKKLSEGTRHIAAQDLDYNVDIKGNDEMARLGRSFNSMAHSLFEYRTKLHDYFYRVVQSLIRILEAKDKYTSGHSERVMDYSFDIGSALGFSTEKLELLKKAAHIHDIGKLAISENILNKKEKLTGEEWAAIKEHPSLGGEILKPALLDEEVVSIVRNHHERYDGTGYPDGLKGDDIHLLAQIISVADAYDAMTSPRAYRNTMSKEKAIAELKSCSGTQFNPTIVNAFLKIIA